MSPDILQTRRDQRVATSALARCGSTIRLTFRPPFRWDAIGSFLGQRAIDGIDSFDGTRFTRIVNGEPVTIEPNGTNALRMTVPTPLARDIHALVVRARRTFDLTADPIAIDEHLRRDRLLRPLLTRRPGPRVPGAWEPFEVAIRAIVGQQITVRGTTTIMNRFFSEGQWSAAVFERNPGMPRARAEAIRTMAEAVENDPSILTRGPSLDETIERLTALKGIGPWTAHYIAMRALGEPDAFPHTDLGLRKAAKMIGIEPARLLAHAERWRPWRAYATIALWESL